jgi:predicted ATPase
LDNTTNYPITQLHLFCNGRQPPANTHLPEKAIYLFGSYGTADEFEMLMLSFYQKLNEERQDILAEFARTGRAYPV